MKYIRSPLTASFVGATACLALNIWSTSALGQAPPGPAPGAGQAAPRGGGMAADPRADNRTYHLEGANIDVPYCVYKSTKVSSSKPAPLIVALHGMGAPPSIMCNKTALDLAEEGGYIYVAPMGYSTTGWYGSPVINMGGARGPGAGARGPGAGPGGPGGPGAGARGPAPGATAPTTASSTCDAPAARGPAPGAAAGGARGPAPGGAGGPPRGAGGPPPAGAGGGAAAAGPSNADIEKWSEADVMNVLGMMRKEFNVDPKRIYLTGHSMGGAGTLFLASKHADLWAAAAPVAPAAFMMEPRRADLLKDMQKANLPLMIVQGDADTVVPATNTRNWAATARELGLKEFKYVEQPCIDHGPVITTSQKDIFEFFAAHSKK